MPRVLRAIHEASNEASKGHVIEPGALVLYFPRPSTVTGEDVLEFHVHGGTAIVKAVLKAISSCSSDRLPIRYAEAGEFTQRAFFNDRLDLPQIEALGDTLSAVTEEQRRLGVQGTSQSVAKRYESWKELLLYARGELEALIDFSEDQHFDESPVELASSVASQVRSLLQTISYHSANAVRGELLRHGIGISLIGSPNVGKSSILNQIVGRNAAIVSKEAGTTRDVVEVGLDLGGFFCRFGDTAGLRQTSPRAAVGEIEEEGIKRAKAKALDSDLVILVLSIEPVISGAGFDLHLDQGVVATASELLASGKNMIAVINKMDNYGSNAAEMSVRIRQSMSELLPRLDASKIHCISCQQALQVSQGLQGSASADPGGVQQFLSGLTQTCKAMTSALLPDDAQATDPSQWEASLGATERQRMLLDTCSEHLHKFLEQVSTGRAETAEMDAQDIDIVMAAESLRSAAECLGRITGRGETSDVNEVLGVVFEK
ncbi:MAG: mitochondrial splicing system protein [Chrysothrix sp. TS-e1954]|nr:MAG: mitochondrial splicing system protein [Chrysothrix sp. TS-e1954]